MKTHEKLAKAVGAWTRASHKAFDTFQKILRELEIKYTKQSMSEATGDFFFNQQSIHFQK